MTKTINNNNADTRNPCSTFPIEDASKSSNYYTIPSFCQPDQGSCGDDIGTEEVKKLSDNDEWKYQERGGSCYLKDAIDGCRSVKGTCANITCSEPGRRTKARRTKYTGDTLTCFKNDLNYWTVQGNQMDFPENFPILCYSDSGMNATCDFNQRDISSTLGLSVMFNYSLGLDLDKNDTSWLNRWRSLDEDNVNVRSPLKPLPIYAIERAMLVTDASDPDRAFMDRLPSFDITIPQDQAALFLSPVKSIKGLIWAQTLMNAVYEKYTSQGFSIGVSPGTTGYNSFTDIIYGIVYNYPGLGKLFLPKLCTFVTTERLNNIPFMVPFCGCYMGEEEYINYVNNFGITKQCVPICNINYNIPLVEPDNVTRRLCDQNVCLIDNTTINISESNVSGDLGFNQVCGGCYDSNCQCIVSDTTVDIINSNIGGISFDQQCGTLQCYQSINNPLTGEDENIQVSCSDTDAFESAVKQLKLITQLNDVNSNINFTVTLIIIIIFLLIVLVGLWIISKQKN